MSETWEQGAGGLGGGGGGGNAGGRYPWAALLILSPECKQGDSLPSI